MSTSTSERRSDDFSQDDLIDDEYDLDLQDHLKHIKKHRWAIFATTFVITSLAALWVSIITPTYRAFATLHIETQQVMPMNLDEIIGIDTDNQQYYQTQFIALRSRKLARRVVEEMGLFSHPELGNIEEKNKFLLNSPVFKSLSNSTGEQTNTIRTDPTEQQKVINRFLERTKVAPVKNTKMVRISFDSADPVLAARIANKIADTYILSYRDSRTEIGEKATKSLHERLNQLKVTLSESQQRLLSYKEVNGLIDIQGNNGNLSEHEIGIITSKLLDAESKLAYAKILFQEVSVTKAKGTNALLSLPVVDSNEMVRRHKINMQNVQFTLDELLNRYGEKHPKVVDAKSRLQTARANLKSQIRNVVATIEKDYLLAQQTTASLRKTLDTGKKEIQNNDRSRLELVHLEREVQLNQDIYDTFYTRSREMNEAENLGTNNAQVTEYAEAPLSPIKPKKALLVILTLLLSAAASIAIALLRELTNNTIASTEDVEFNLGTRMLGILPLVSKRTLARSGATALVPGSYNEDKRAFEECIRTIRTSICLDDLTNPQKVIMVTSALPSEGKSTLASHLAHSLANVERVLLIECDLRRPSLHLAFDFENAMGLAQLLSGDARFSQSIKLKAIGNLDVMPAGAIPARPLDLLTSKRFSLLIKLMRKRYDRIIIDSAPVQAVSDALLLGQTADTVLYTVKANSTSTQMAARGVRRLHQAGINVLGVVVSQVNLKKLASHGGELNYDGYYDYYGYSDISHSPIAQSEKLNIKHQGDFPSTLTG